MELRERAAAIHSDLEELRHALHREPEIGLHLPMTQKKVVDALGGMPLAITTGERLSSVTGVLRGDQPGATVLLRGDMDALQVQEMTGVPFSSTIDGIMHACGHDLHTAMLVGAARLLAERRSELPGEVIFMFQPGEEGCDGAGHMLAEGVLDVTGDRPAAAYAIHVMSSTWAHGVFTTRAGTMMAASDALTVSVMGSGGHGSAPHLARDPVPAACEMVAGLQTLLTRTVDPLETAVITVGSFHAGTRRNVIPEAAHFDATVRTFSPSVREQIAVACVRLCKGIAAAHGLEVEATYHTEYPVTVNDADETRFAAGVVDDVFGPERFVPMANPVTGAEDFSRLLNEVPGAMTFLGAVPMHEDPTTAAYNHSAYATFDDAVLSDGAALYAELAWRRLQLATGRDGQG